MKFLLNILLLLPLFVLAQDITITQEGNKYKLENNISPENLVPCDETNIPYYTFYYEFGDGNYLKMLDSNEPVYFWYQEGLQF